MNPELLKTIRANKNFHYLTDRLPKSNYQNGHEYEKNQKLNMSAKGKNEIRPSGVTNVKSINLPKLDRILVKGSSSKQNGIHLQHHERPQHPLLQPKASKIDMNEMLKI